MRKSCGIAAATLAAVAGLLLPPGAAGSPSPRLGEQLKRGGLVLVLRHAATDQSKQDEDPVDLADCTTQRNLSAEGRAQARAIGRGARGSSSDRDGADKPVLPHARDGAARLRPRRGRAGAAEHDRAAHDDGLAPADPRRAPADRDTAGRRARSPFSSHTGSWSSEATGADARGGRDARLPAAREGPLPGSWGASRRTSGGRSALRPHVHRSASRSTPCLPDRIRTTSRPRRDGTVWYTRRAREARRLDPATGKVTEVPLGDGSAPHGVIVGPDGAAVGDGRRSQRDRPRRSRDARRQALPAAGVERVREPQHGNVRPARPALVHRPERHLRSRRPATGALRVFRAPGARPVRHRDDAGRPGLVRVARRQPHRPDRPRHRKATIVRPPTPARARGGSGPTPAAGSG